MKHSVSINFKGVSGHFVFYKTKNEKNIFQKNENEMKK